MSPEIRPIEQSSGDNKDIGEVFTPFETLPPFPREVRLGARPEVFAYPLTFQGIPGRIALISETTPEDFTSIVTPLGKAQLITSYEQDRETVEVSPVTLELRFNITTMDQYYDLEHFLVKFSIAGQNYYLFCGGCDSTAAVRKTLEDREKMELFDSNIHPKDDPTGTVLFPYDSEKLSSIKASIVEEPAIYATTFSPR